MWFPVLAASLGAFALKLIGYFVPAAWMENQTFKRITGLLPIGLLSGLIVVQSIGDKQSLVVDGRLAAVVIAIVASWKKAPFIVIILLAASLTAAGRHFGVLS